MRLLDYGIFFYFSMIKCWFYLLLLVICTFTTSANATLQMPKINPDVAIKIDGDLNEPAWEQASKTWMYYETWPGETIPTPVQTEVFFFEDGQTLYFGFKAEDPEPDKIRAGYHERDSAWRDDLLGVKLDPYNNSLLAFQFLVNPLGVQIDSTDDTIAKDFNDDWDGIWYSMGKLTDDGYQVEIAIPMVNINFSPSTEKQLWGVEFLRIYPREQYYRLSNLKIDRNIECWTCQMIELEGFEGLSPGKSLSLAPSVVTGIEQVKTPPISSSDFESANAFEPGLDIRWARDSDLYINATINPDFSQVESDAPQLGFNNNFSLFFKEKRPFFVENQSIFRSELDFVHTRNINAPDFGLKLTARKNKHTFGVFATDDETTTLLVPGDLSSQITTINEESKNIAMRYRYDAGDEFYAGVLSTIRETNSYKNHLVSTDFRYRLTGQDVISGQVAYSETRYPEDLNEQFTSGESCHLESERESSQCSYSEQFFRADPASNYRDSSAQISYRHDEKEWYLGVDYLYIGGDFRADLGFVNQVGISEKNIEYGDVIFLDEGGWWYQLIPKVAWKDIDNEEGINLDRAISLGLVAHGAYQSTLELGCESGQKSGTRVDSSTLSLVGNVKQFDINHYCNLDAEIIPASGAKLKLSLSSGDTVDYLNNREATELLFVQSFEHDINRFFTIFQEYKFQRLTADGAEVFTTHQADLRLKYNFNLRNSLKWNINITDVSVNESNQPLDQASNLSSQLSTQLIYSYQLNPRTVFFAGYSSNAVQLLDNNTFHRDRQNLFLKFSYVWSY